MKKSRIIQIALALSLVLSGCTAMNSSTEEKQVKQEKQVNNKFSGSAKTVKDMKEKYGSENRQEIMPMYNVEANKEFTFTFPYDIGRLNPSDMISVHTDIKAKPESEIFAMVGMDFGVKGNKTAIYVKPGSATLPSEKDYDSDKPTWGNAPIYYIRINYDLKSKTPKKLKEPIIVPFTIKSDLPVPNLRKEISPDGRLKLVWDKVEGAEKYNVYQVSKITLLETTNIAPTSAETGYQGFPHVQTTTTNTEFQDFVNNGANGLNQTEETISIQNMGLNGDYFVTAVAGDKESNFSVPVSTPALSSQLPLKVKENLSFATFDSVKDLPKTVQLEFIDGSFQNREVVYDLANANIKVETNVNFSIKGTALKGYLTIRNMTEADKTVQPPTTNDNPNTGFVEPKNETDDVPDPSVPTIIEKVKEKIKNKKSKSNKEKNIVAEQQQNTKDQVDKANKEKIAAPKVANEFEINANSALEEYLALNLINAETEISLEAFPEAQNGQALQDVLLKVIYQNPLILGVRGYKYEYSTLTLQIKYDESADVIKQKQKEIVKEAKKIVSSVIKSSMSAEEKRKALYDYLNDKTKYDNEALKNAEKNNFRGIDDSFVDAFTTYGIMVNKNGVCQSYAMTYKMLSDLAGIETIVVTGTSSGVPHAWNKVKIGKEWLHVDNTNNETNVGIPYMVYGSNDSTIQDLNYVVDKDYWVDGELGKFAGKTDQHDYYVANELEVKNMKDLQSQLKKALQENKTTIAIRLSKTFDDDTLMNAIGEVINDVAPDKLNSTQYGMIGNKFLMIKIE